jgi:hypothetical protein
MAPAPRFAHARSPSRLCDDPQRAPRIFIETLAGTVTSASALLLAYFATDARTFEEVSLGVLGGMMVHLVATPAAIGLAGTSMGANGRYWAALLGNLLLPVAGGVVGYELSHTPHCDDPSLEGTPRARPPLPRSFPLRASPVLAPNLTGLGGGTAGVSITF